MDENDQNLNNGNQNYSIYGDDMDTHDHEQQQSFKFKRINDYIENHYHDSNSDDIDMDGHNIGETNGKISIASSSFLTLLSF